MIEKGRRKAPIIFVSTEERENGGFYLYKWVFAYYLAYAGASSQRGAKRCITFTGIELVNTMNEKRINLTDLGPDYYHLMKDNE